MLALLLALTLTQQIDRDGRQAFTALRDFQAIELAAVKAHDAWPTPTQQTAIAAKLAIAYECLTDSFVLSADVTVGKPLDPKVQSLLRSQTEALAALNGLVGPTAPVAARKAMITVQDRFASLLAHLAMGDVNVRPR